MHKLLPLAVALFAGCVARPTMQMRKPIRLAPSPSSCRFRRAARLTRWRARWPSTCAARSASRSWWKIRPAPAARWPSAASLARRARRLYARASAIGRAMSSWPATHIVPYDIVNDLSRSRACRHAALDRDQEGSAGDRPEGTGRLAQSQSRQGFRRNCRRRSRRAYLRARVPDRHRDEVSIHAVSRRRAGHAGPCGRADRHDVRHGGEHAAPGSLRQHQAYGGHVQEPLVRGARGADRGGDGRAGRLSVVVARTVGLEGQRRRTSSPSSTPR